MSTDYHEDTKGQPLEANSSPHASKPTAGPNADGPTAGGKCTFDGSQYPDWLPINPFKDAEMPTEFPLPEVEGDPWNNTAGLVKNFDDEMCVAWTEEIQNILLFAGLFSAVVTAFAVETQAMLQPDPAVASVLLLARLTQMGNASDIAFVSAITAPFQQTSLTHPIRVNALIYFSLVLSLGTALVGIIALQWVRSYKRTYPLSPKDRIALRHIRYQSLLQWRVPEIISILPIILQASLIIFFVGLIDFLRLLDRTVAIVISTLIGVIVLFVTLTMVAPALSVLVGTFHEQVAARFEIREPFKLSLSPYQSPQSWVLVRIVLLFTRYYESTGSSGVGSAAVSGSTAWPDLARRYSAQTMDRPIMVHSSFSWIIRYFTDMESFCSIYRCFQTLELEEMIGVLWTLHLDSEGYIDRDVKNDLDSAPNKHMVSLLLINWFSGHDWWRHHSVDLHSFEMLLRPTDLDGRRLTANLYMKNVWEYTICRLTPNVYVKDQSEMWIYSALVCLETSGTATTFTEGRSASPKEMATPLAACVLDCLDRGTTEIADDILGAFTRWLSAWQERSHTKLVTKGTWQRETMEGFMSTLPNGAMLKILLQRPTYKALLHCFMTDKGQEVWKCLKDNCWPFSDSYFRERWDLALVDGMLGEEYAALIFDDGRREASQVVGGKNGEMKEEVYFEYGLGSMVDQRSATRLQPSSYPIHSMDTLNSSGRADAADLASITIENTTTIAHWHTGTIHIPYASLRSTHSVVDHDLELGIEGHVDSRI